ncbi:MAG: UvrB/UvrC motif-containing protein [Planctomycetota bacterium]
MADRPDGERPHGFSTYYDFLVATAFAEGERFALDQERCREIDREFYQYYHRRICWLSLKKYASAVRDATHSLQLMDFSSANAPDPRWALMHEQYRPFVMFHRIQAASLLSLEDADPKAAIDAIDRGLDELSDVFQRHESGEHFEEDAFVKKLREMRGSIVDQFEVGPSLAEQLAEAIAAERYELAAELRDRMGRQGEENEPR